MEKITENLIFKAIHNLKWNPFIGNNYFNIPEENRILVIGESHYHGNTEKEKATVNDVDYTKEFIQEAVIKDERWGTKIFPNFHMAMFGDNSFDLDKFWNLTSFYNFIQRPMLTIDDRPNENDWADGWKTFFDLIKVIKPKTCLFIGVSASNHLMSAIHQSCFSCKEVIIGEMINGTYSRKTTLIDSQNNEINILFMKHSSQYFSWNSWNRYLKKEIPNQLFWFENKIDMIETETDETKIIKEKLNEVYKTIHTNQFDSIVDNFKSVPPAKSGEYSDCCSFVFDINKYSFTYEIDIDNSGFCSYYWNNKDSHSKISVLSEKGKELGYDENWGITFDDKKTSKEIANEITMKILKIISILKEESKL